MSMLNYTEIVENAALCTDSNRNRFTTIDLSSADPYLPDQFEYKYVYFIHCGLGFQAFSRFYNGSSKWSHCEAQDAELLKTEWPHIALLPAS